MVQEDHIYVSTLKRASNMSKWLGACYKEELLMKEH